VRAWLAAAWPGQGATLLPAYRGTVVLSLLLVTWCSFPSADARGHELGAGPPLDAYPWAHQWNPVALDPWGFVQRQCTSFVAWWLNTHGVPFAALTRGPSGQAVFLDAAGWDASARTAGFAVSTAPAVGSVAQWRAEESSPTVLDAEPDGAFGDPADAALALTATGHGHVAVVVAVLADGSVLVAGFDGADRGFHLVHTRAPRYLVIGEPRGSPPVVDHDLAPRAAAG
jgi:surface antigen